MNSAIDPPLTFHIGFTGTCHGMSDHQRRAVSALLAHMADIHRVPIVAHHGCRVGSDEDFHALARERGWRVIGHPGLESPIGTLRVSVECDELLIPASHRKSNSAIAVTIVPASHIVIATPRDAIPWPPGDHWDVIGVAIRALNRGALKELHVFGHDGEVLDYTRWRLHEMADVKRLDWIP